MKNYIGTVLKVKEANYDHILRNWRNTLIPLLKSIMANYKLLVKEDMDIETIRLLISGRMPGVTTKANENLEKELQFTTINILHEMAKKELRERIAAFEAEVKAFHERKSVCQYSVLETYEYEPEDISIEDGELVIDTDRILARCSIVIETEQQCNLYHKILNVEKAWNDLREFLNANGYQKSGRRPIFGGAGLFYEDEDQSLKFIPEKINL